MAKTTKNYKPAKVPEKSKKWVKEYYRLQDLWDKGKYDNLNEWGHSLFNKPGFFSVNPKPDKIKNATPEQIEFIKNCLYYEREERPEWMNKSDRVTLAKNDLWESLTTNQKKECFDRFLVKNWNEQLEVFNTYVCWGFNQPYKNQWSEDIANTHEEDLLNRVSVWGFLFEKNGELSSYDLEQGRENAKEEHKNYLVNIPDKRQATLFDKSGKPVYVPKNANKEGLHEKAVSVSSPKKENTAIVKWKPPNKSAKKTKKRHKTQTDIPAQLKGVQGAIAGRKDTLKGGVSKPVHASWSFLGWVLEFTLFDYVSNKVYRWTWRESEALAMLARDNHSLFITRMAEHAGESWETPPSVKKVKKLFETWSKKKAHLKWSATVEDLPEIIPDFEPMSIKYWSDKYSDDPIGQVYFHEFEPDTGIKMGLNLTKHFPKPKPIAIHVIGCRITHRGIE